MFDPGFLCRYVCDPSGCGVILQSRGAPADCTHTSHTILPGSERRCVCIMLLLCVHDLTCLTLVFSADTCAIPAAVALFYSHVGRLPIAHTHRTPFFLVLSAGVFALCCFCVCMTLHV